MTRLSLKIPTSVFPAKAGIQIHPERLVGFIWTPAFAGETGIIVEAREARTGIQKFESFTSRR